MSEKKKNQIFFVPLKKIPTSVENEKNAKNLNYWNSTDRQTSDNSRSAKTY